MSWLSTTADAAGVDEVRCAAAAAPTAAGHPLEALDRIDALRASLGRADACTPQRAEAEAVIRGVSQQLDSITRTGAQPSVQLTSRLTRARQALARNLDDPAAKALVVQLEAEVAEAKVTPKVWPHAAAEALSTWIKGPGADLASLLTAGLALVAALLTLARLLLLSGRRAPRLGGRLSGPRTPLALLVVAAVVVPWWTVRTWSSTSDPTWSALPILGVLGVVVVVVWRWLFWRRRVRIEMQEKGADATAGALAVVAHLRNLGANPPKGLEIPLGSDVQALSGENISSSVKGMLSSLVGILQTLVGVTPWRVLVDKDDDNQFSVLVSRHGRAVKTAVVRTRPWAHGPELDPYKSIAAFALMTLSETYHFPGLGSASDWRSVAWQYDASTPARPREERSFLLAKAASQDPDNLAAQMAFRVELDRRSDDGRRLEDLASWLLHLDGRLVEDGDLALRGRTLYNALVAASNSAAAAVPGRSARRLAVEAGDRLTAIGADLKALPGRLGVRIMENVERIRTSSPIPAWTPGSPGEAYRDACLIADRSPALPDYAYRFLRIAFADPSFVESASSDPMLRVVRGLPAYAAQFAVAPLDDPFAIEPLASFAGRLTPLGLTDLSTIAAVPERWLVEALGSVSAAQQVRDVAELVTKVPAELSTYSLELARFLADNGITGEAQRLAAVQPLGTRGPELQAGFSRACATRSLAEPDSVAMFAYLP